MVMRFSRMILWMRGQRYYHVHSGYVEMPLEAIFFLQRCPLSSHEITLNRVNMQFAQNQHNAFQVTCHKEKSVVKNL